MSAVKPKKAPNVVAELGRPETPEETAIRKAENSRKYRAHKTVNNLVLSMLVTVAAVVIIVLAVPRSNTPIERNIDYATTASQVQIGIPDPIVSPVLPGGWRANSAEWRTAAGSADNVPSWNIGLLTPENQYIGLSQALGANATWIANQLQRQAAVETTSIDGVTWDVYRNTVPEDDRGNFEYALVTAAGNSTYLLIGTADETEFAVLASALSDDILSNQEPTTESPSNDAPTPTGENNG
ncbi:DUF4245 domain-containing protein [Leifsonia sp. A12D58]|uniref:DUF4245 domain-containing protein n=1 Tax=Leifsonia sp. A12D58 TaxID=3397674 RepID=UPI0039DF7202